MYSTSVSAEKIGSQLQKEQSFRYKQVFFLVWYTLIETYFFSIILKSTNMAMNLFIYGTAIVKPKTSIRGMTVANDCRTFRSGSHPGSECEVSASKLMPNISLEDCSLNPESFTAFPRSFSSGALPNYSAVIVPAEHNVDYNSEKPSENPTEPTVDCHLNVCQNSGYQQNTLEPSQQPIEPHSITDASICQIKEQGPMITSCELVSLLNNEDAVLLLDCRTFMAFNSNHILGAVNVCCSDRITKKRLADGKIGVGDVVCGQEGKEMYKRLEGEAEIVVYDESSTELEAVQAGHPLKVITECLGKHGRRARFLIGGLQAFQQSYSCMCSQPDPSAGVQLLFSPTSPQVNCDIDAAVASEILSYLFIGNQRDAANKERLVQLGITHIINVTSQLPLNFEGEGFSYKRLPATDSGSQNLKQYFTEAVEFIDNARESQGKVLVHCQAGVSRSPTIVLAYLMARSQKSLTEAFNLVKELRPIIAPNLNFMGQLLEFEQLTVQRSGLCPPSQSVDLLRL